MPAIMPLVASFVFAAAFPASASAQVPTGRGPDAQVFVDRCQRPTAQEILDRPAVGNNISFCLGFMDALLQYNQELRLIGSSPILFCAPPTVSPDRARQVFLEHMFDHPESLDDHSAWMVIQALTAAFPCTEE